MTLLNRLFGDTESLALEAKKDERSFLDAWTGYKDTLTGKARIISNLGASFGQKRQSLQSLMKLLDTELADTKKEQDYERDLTFDFHNLKHSKKIRRIKRLEECLGYAETKFRYVYELLHHLFIVLRAERRICEELLKVDDLRKYRTKIESLNSELLVEKEIMDKIDQIGTFETLFVALLSGEHIIHTMDNKEKRYLKKMKKGIGDIFKNKKTDGITCEWAMSVYNAIEDKVHAAVAEGMFPGYHPSIDFEFVNRQEFIVLVREKLLPLRARLIAAVVVPEEKVAALIVDKNDLSEQMMNTFVHLFREWYNHERD